MKLRLVTQPLFAVSVLAIVGALVVSSPSPIRAMGEAPPADPCKTLTKGSSDWKKCRKKAGLPSVADGVDEAYALGYALAQKGDYAQALRVLKPVEDSNDVRVLTYIGFSLRNLGRIEDALSYYDRAIAIDPTNVATLEYMGKAHLTLGDLTAANRKLERIKSICGTECEAYKSLATAIAETQRS